MERRSIKTKNGSKIEELMSIIEQKYDEINKEFD
jgi:hypothetical protein